MNNETKRLQRVMLSAERKYLATLNTSPGAFRFPPEAVKRYREAWEEAVAAFEKAKAKEDDHG